MLRLWLGHRERIESLFESLCRKDSFVQAELSNGPAGGEGLFGELRGFLVADVRVLSLSPSTGSARRGFASFRVGFQIPHAEFDEGMDTVRQQVDRFQGGMTHNRHHNVELEIAAGRATHRHRRIVTDDSCRQLHHTLTHDRIDFARHDRATRLPIGEDDFKETTTRPRSQPTNVVRKIEKGHGNRLKLTVRFDQSVALGVGLEVIHRFNEVQTGLGLEILRHATSELGVGVDPGADRRTADGQLENRLNRGLGSFNREFNLPRKAAKFLPKSQRCGIHQMRSTDFDDPIPLFGLLT